MPNSASQPLLRIKRKGFFYISVFITLLAVLLHQVNVLEEFESRAWDWRLRTFPLQLDPASKVRIIDIDQPSLDYLANTEKITWPWPRSIYGDVLLEFLKRAGARAVAFDILFTENTYRTVSEDEAFAAAITAVSPSLPIVSAISFRASGEDQESSDRYTTFRKKQLEQDQKTNFAQHYLAFPQIPRYQAVTLAIDQLIQPSAALGNVKGEPDREGVFRHFIPGGYVDGIPVLSLPLAMLNLVGERPRQNINEFMDEKGRVAIRFYGPRRTIHTTSFADIFQSVQNIMQGTPPLVPLDDFKNTYVFVGMSAPGLMDLRPTPWAKDFPGVELNGTILENLISGGFAKKMSPVLALVLTGLLTMCVTFAGLFVSNLRLQLMALCLLIFGFLFGTYTAAYFGLWVPMVLPMSAAILAILSSMTFQYQLEGRQHRFIRNAFRHYVSPTVIDEIVRDPAQLSLGGERRELTIFFSDIAGFTGISEAVEASKLVPLLNTYLTTMTDIVLQYGGTVDKYVGDAVVAFWNAPLPIPDHALRAVQAAIACQQRLHELDDEFQLEYGLRIRTRIGINTGVVNVGNFGSRDRFNYTVIGDAANLGSRLEGANKYFGTNILIAESTYIQLRNLIACRKIADIRVVGKSKPVSVYQPISPELGEGISSQQSMLFGEALQSFEQADLSKALEQFKRLAKDSVARVYVTRIERDLERKKDDWSPVWNLGEK